MRKLFISIQIFFTLSCTENPFFNNNFNPGSNNTIHGNVQLSNHPDNSGVLIWMNKFNIFTFSDEAGNYSLKIPGKSEDVPGGGLSGITTIYYYVANYWLDSTTVVLFDNSFKAGESDLDIDGRITNIILRKMAEINTNVNPSTIISSIENAVTVSTKIETFSGNDVRIVTWLTRDDDLASFYLNSLTDERSILFKSSTRLSFLNFQGTLQLKGLLNIPANTIPPGSYELFPFLQLIQNLPDGMLEVLGNDVDGFSKNYLKVPFKQQKAIITVLE